MIYTPDSRCARLGAQPPRNQHRSNQKPEFSLLVGEAVVLRQHTISSVMGLDLAP
jgi:hypothetical protein